MLTICSRTWTVRWAPDIGKRGDSVIGPSNLYPGSYPRRALSIASLALLVTIGSAPVSVQADEAVGPGLPPKIRGLLLQEMQSINEAGRDIFSALIAGDDARVASLAQQIHDSFIMRQSLTPEDRRQLRAAVPDAFIEMDRGLHEAAHALAQAAAAGDRPLQRERFGRILAACGACHARFAVDRFPGFRSEGNAAAVE